MIPLTEKYRPRQLSDIVSQDSNIKILKECLEHNRLPHMLFSGPPGTGKTSTIMALSRELHGEHYKLMILELNGSDDRGINVIRSQIKNFARIKNLLNADKPKIIILDEADSLTTDAQFALRRVIEKYTNNVRFCIICNYLNKVIPAIQSRCVLFRFSSINLKSVKSRIKFIKKEENLKIKSSHIDTLCNYAKGDFRKILNFLQQDDFSEENMTSCFWGISGIHFSNLEVLMLKPIEFLETKHVLSDVITNSKIDFQNFLTIYTYIGQKHKNYLFLRKLANLEYHYYHSNYMFPSIFILALASILCRETSINTLPDNS